MSNESVSAVVHQSQLLSRPLPLLPILMAQQAVLGPLFFFVPLWILGLNLLVVAFTLYRLKHPEYVIPIWLKTIITMVAVAGILLAFRKLSGRDAGVALISVMYCLKIIEVYRRRDAFVMLILGFFMMVSVFLFSQKLWLALYQLLAITAVLNGLLALHRLSLNRNDVVSLPILLKIMSRYLVVALPIMLVLFVFFPRLSSPMWRMPGGSNSASGISDTMSPGDVASLRLFEKVAFRVRFFGEQPQPGQLYWRAFVLDKFDGLTWTRQKKPDRKSVDIKRNAEAKSFSYEITLEQNRQNWLITLDRPLQVPKQARILADSAVFNQFRILDRTRYEAVSVPKMIIDSNLKPQQRQFNLQLPKDGDPRAKAYAQQLRKDFSNNVDIVNHLLREINQQQFFYTLSPPLLQQDTIDDFWFEQKRGFCEHYASAFVYLLRAAGVPARVVVGYQGADKNPLSDYSIVRYLNAHAWSEVWLKGRGWVRVDPTAAISPSRIEDDLLADYRQRDSLFDNFSADVVDLNNLSIYQNMVYWMDEVNANWNEWVLDFGQDNRRNLINSLGLGSFDEQQILLIMGIIVALFLVLTSFGWFRYRRPQSNSARAFVKLLDKLISAGVLEIDSKQLNHVGLEALKKQLKGCNDEQKHKINDLIDEYCELVYGQQHVDEKRMKEFRLRLNRLKIRGPS